jgi:hypothetical protein
MSSFSADDIINKTLIAKINVVAYSQPFITSPVYAAYKSGQTIGVVYSYVIKNGVIWWLFYDVNKKPYYVQHKEGKFSLTSLKDQGAKTTAQKTKEKEEKEKEENSTILDKFAAFGSDFGSTLKWVLIAAIVAFGLYYAFEAGLFKKMIKK